MVKPYCSNSRVNTANFSDVRILRIFTINFVVKETKIHKNHGQSFIAFVFELI